MLPSDAVNVVLCRVRCLEDRRQLRGALRGGLRGAAGSAGDPMASDAARAHVCAVEDKCAQLECAHLLSADVAPFCRELASVLTCTRTHLEGESGVLSLEDADDAAWLDGTAEDDAVRQMSEARDRLLPSHADKGWRAPAGIIGLRVEAALCGSSVMSAQLHLELSKGGTGKTHTIVQSQPWRLTQVEDALSLLAQVDEALAELRVLSETPLTIEPVFALVSRMTTLLRSARSVMLRPCRHAFPQVNPNDVNTFRPPLPRDALVEFSVRGADLLVTATTVMDASSKPRTSTTGGLEAPPLVYHGRAVDVADEVVLQTRVATFEAGLDSIEYGHGICTRLRDKLAVHLSS